MTGTTGAVTPGSPAYRYAFNARTFRDLLRPAAKVKAAELSHCRLAPIRAPAVGVPHPVGSKKPTGSGAVPFRSATFTLPQTAPPVYGAVVTT